MSLSLKFNNNFALSEDTIWIFPFKEDINNIMRNLSVGSSIVGNLFTIETFLDKLSAFYISNKNKLRPATRFAIVQRLFLQSELLSL